jgi:ribosomal protein L36
VSFLPRRKGVCKAENGKTVRREGVSNVRRTGRSNIIRREGVSNVI